MYIVENSLSQLGTWVRRILRENSSPHIALDQYDVRFTDPFWPRGCVITCGRKDVEYPAFFSCTKSGGDRVKVVLSLYSSQLFAVLILG